MIRLFCGHDRREAPGLHTFMHSVLKRARRPVALTPLAALGLEEGSNAFTLSRFLVAYLCGYTGHAIFCDASDMLMQANVAELDALFDSEFAVQVVKHPDYVSRHERKYVGTEMDCAQSNYPRKNWASVMLVNCADPRWRAITPQSLAQADKLDLLQFRFLEDHQIGELPPEWNVLVDEGQDDAGAKILHWTAGIPMFPHYRDAWRAADWFLEASEIAGTSPRAAH